MDAQSFHRLALVPLVLFENPAQKMCFELAHGLIHAVSPGDHLTNRDSQATRVDPYPSSPEGNAPGNGAPVSCS